MSKSIREITKEVFNNREKAWVDSPNTISQLEMDVLFERVVSAINIAELKGYKQGFDAGLSVNRGIQDAKDGKLNPDPTEKKGLFKWLENKLKWKIKLGGGSSINQDTFYTKEADETLDKYNDWEKSHPLKKSDLKALKARLAKKVNND